MEELVIGIDSGLLGDSLTAFPALNELSKQKPFRLWINNRQVRSLWTHDKVSLLDERPPVYQGFDILDGYRKFAFSGLHIVQSWFDNFGLPIPQYWEKPKINVLETRDISDVFDVVVCPFSRSGGGDLKVISYYKWDNIIRTLISAGLRVAVAGCFSSGEDPRFWSSLGVIEFDTVPLPALAGKFLLARCVVTIDTGPGHLAHFLGVRHVHLIAQHPNLAPKEWVQNRNQNATIIFEKFASIPQERILGDIFSALSEFNRSEYLEANKEFESQPSFYSNRLAAWQHFCLFGRAEGRKVSSPEEHIVPGWHDDIFSGNLVLDTKEMFESFLSLGDNCEFGLVQRHFGAEPLDLLRWMTVPFTALCQLFENRFEGFAEGDNLDIEDHAGEYAIHEKKYGLFGHSFVKVGSVDHDVFLKETRGRFLFLRRKMMDDLDEGRRILVYKCNQPLSNEQKFELFRCVSSATKCPLLIAEIASGAHLVGAIERPAERLFCGFVERFAPYERAFEICPSSWLGVAWKVLDVVRKSTPAHAAVGYDGSSDGSEHENEYQAQDKHEGSRAHELVADSRTFVPLELVLTSGVLEERQAFVTVSGDHYRCVVDFDVVHGLSEFFFDVYIDDARKDNFQSLFEVRFGLDRGDFYKLRLLRIIDGNSDAKQKIIVFGAIIPVVGRVLEISWSGIEVKNIRGFRILCEDDPLVAINAGLVF